MQQGNGGRPAGGGLTWTASETTSNPPQSTRHASEDYEDNNGPEKKKRRTSGTPRRPLSCTACKKRKTRCSSGVIPCEACVKRGKPEDCKWGEDGNGESLRPEHTFALSSDLEALRREVQTLSAAVYGSPNHISSSPAFSSVHRSPSTSFTSEFRNASLPPPQPSRLAMLSGSSKPPPDPLGRNIESAVISLENLAHAQEDSNRGSPNTGTHRSSSGVLSPFANSNSGNPPPPSPGKLELPRLLDRSTREDELQATVFEILPRQEAATRISHAYFTGRVHGNWHILHEPSFSLEFVKFYSSNLAAQKAETDPAWISILLMVFALGLQDVPPEDAQPFFPEYDSTAIARLPSAFYQASRMALELAKGDSMPQIRLCQVSLLYFPFLYHFGFGVADSLSALNHLGLAISTAQWLGLDRLGDPRNTGPMDDIAFKGQPRPLALELCKRIYGMMNFLDGTSARRTGQWRLEHSATAPHATPLPLNLNDDDLLLDPLPPERPQLEITAATVPIVGSLFALCVRKYMAAGNAAPHPLPDAGSDEDERTLDYEYVKRYDAELRQVLSHLPSPLSGSRTAPSWTQVNLWSSLHNRILRIHRPLMPRGYTDAAFHFSTAASISSAKEIIVAQRIMMACPDLRPGFMKGWLLGAALLLAVDLVVAVDTNQSPEIIASKRGDITSALEIFQQRVLLDRTPALTEQCGRTIEAVLVASDARLRARQSGQAPNGESLQAFFQSVSAALARSKAPSEASEEYNVSATLLQMAADASTSTKSLAKAPDNNLTAPARFDPSGSTPIDFSSFNFSLNDLDLSGLLDFDDASYDAAGPADALDFGLFGGWSSTGFPQ